MIVNLTKTRLVAMVTSLIPGENCRDLFQMKDLGFLLHGAIKKDWFWNHEKLNSLDESILWAIYIACLENKIL